MMLIDSAQCPLAAAGILAPQSSRSRSYLAEACFLAATLCPVEVLSLDRLLKERDLLSEGVEVPEVLADWPGELV